jgi:esterase/lipase
MLLARAKGPVEQVVLERSYHVATLDFDKDEIEARTVEFLTAVLPAPPGNHS